ncbi:uncharacterized protein LOC129228247 [Uloborus diversus]|uniref:uncharacterized protein LOC129228247 n=1 Tax=Uloborus diversus TaxID=327109 RepID=UPI00240A74F7|nr:uncharacterized protein LOC129228247 [Uloborus diversus]
MAEEIVETLKLHIEILKNEDMLEDKSFFVSTVFVMLAIQNGSKWAENITSNFILPCVVKYSAEISNESAFKFFAHLYVDMCLLFPKELYKEKFMKNLFTKSLRELREDPTCVKGDFRYVTATVACCLLKFKTVMDEALPKCIFNWSSRNLRTKEVENHDIQSFFWQRFVSMGDHVSKEDCVITKQHLLSSDLLRDL